MTLNDDFAFQLDAIGIPYEREYKPIPGRRFAYDFFIGNLNDEPMLIELQGGVWMKKGGHNTGKGISRDCEKLNLAVVNGYKVLHFTTDMVKSGEALNIVEKILESK